MLEPDKRDNPNPSIMVDPPGWVRYLARWQMRDVLDTGRIKAQRERFEARRKQANEPHTVDYFHQLDDPYSHLTAQVLARFAERYNVTIRPHLIRASGGRNQPEAEKLAVLARRDASLIGPHFSLSFPEQAGTVPDDVLTHKAARILAGLSGSEFIAQIAGISEALWSGDRDRIVNHPSPMASGDQAIQAISDGSDLLHKMGHYSGATLYYGGEWYWGVDRLFHLEDRLRELGLCTAPDEPFLAPRPSLDVTGIDASALRLDFYPSLNSPYTSIIFDRTIALKNACGIEFHHKPVLPMIMRGVPATRAKMRYILFDTKREADYFGVPFGNAITPIGTPTRKAYSLLPWAREQGKDEVLMSEMLRGAFSKGLPLHTSSGMRKAVEAAGLDWSEAEKRIGDESWKAFVEQNQKEMIQDMGLWGVPSFRLSGGGGEDVAVWGQDRLWVIAAEIRRRCQ